MYLVAPTEPPSLKSRGKVSLLPEKFGVDILIKTNKRLFGVQRKEVGDFLASLHDGRLSVERAQMKRLLGLGGAVLLIVEGRMKWSADGFLMRDYGKPFSRDQFRRYVASCQAAGIWVEFTDNITDTIDCVESYAGWLSKQTHVAPSRPGPIPQWGKPTSREWLIHLGQSWPSMGPTRAAALLDHFDGRFPLQWTVGEKELLQVPGLGLKTVRALLESLDQSPLKPSHVSGKQRMLPKNVGNGKEPRTENQDTE